MRKLSVLVAVWLSAGSALAQEVAPSEPAPKKEWLELGVQLGHLWGSDTEGFPQKGFGMRVQAFFDLGPYLALGPEVAVYEGAGSETLVTQRPGGGEGYTLAPEDLLQFGGLLRGGVELGRFRPSLLLGLGQSLGGPGGLSLNVGGQVSVRIRKGMRAFAEARYHENLVRVRPNYTSIGLGTSLAW